MIVKPIRSEADYEKSLARIEELMDARAGTADGDELEVLATLVERYEDQRFPIAAPTPIAAIRFRMEQESLTSRDLEPFLGSRSRVSEVLSGARPLSIDMIRALHAHLGIPAEVLIRSEPHTQERSGAELSKAAAKQLTELGLLGARESFEAFVARALGGAPSMAMLRATRTDRTNAKTDLVAVQGWCAGALLLSQEVNVNAKFEPGQLEFEAARSLAKLSVYEDGPRRAKQWLADIGVALVILPHLSGTHLDGAALRRADDTPVIAMTLRRDRIDNFWFTLLHELAHVKSHLTPGTAAILDDLEIGSSEEIESEADRMAQEALIPPDLWATFNSSTYASVADVIALAHRAEVNVAIVAGRWQLHNRDYRKFSKLLGHGTVRQQFPEAT